MDVFIGGHILKSLNLSLLGRFVTVLTCALFNTSTATAGGDARDDATSAELVGAGSISTEEREFATSLSPSGDVLYFNRSDIPGIFQIWVSEKQSTGWGAAIKVSFSDDRYADVDPFVSRSGDRLYFSSDRPLPGAANAAPTPDYNTWYAPMEMGVWGQPVYAGPEINSDADEVFISESLAGRVLFVRFGEGEGRVRSTSLITAQRSGHRFVERAQIITAPASLRLSNPALSPDGKLIVAAGLAGGPPKLFYSRKLVTGEWQEFHELPAPINLPNYAQFAPYIANDGKTLYFSSNRPAEGAGEDNIFRAAMPPEATSR